MGRKTQKVLGYDVDLLTCEEAINVMVEKIRKKEGMQVVTINPEMIEFARKDNNFSSLLRHADLVVPDSSGIILALKLKGIEQEQVPGIDLAYDLIRTCKDLKFSLALIGSREEILQKTVTLLKSEFEGLNISYSHNGYFSKEQGDEIINNLVETAPQVVLVALGSPKQEFFIKKCRKKMENTVFIGVGGSFDVWAGEVKRAPEFFRIMGCEWLYRTYKQPSRLKRIYKTLPLFLFRSIIEAVKFRIFKRKTDE